jgi:hypothetical protein
VDECPESQEKSKTGIYHVMVRGIGQQKSYQWLVQGFLYAVFDQLLQFDLYGVLIQVYNLPGQD